MFCYTDVAVLRRGVKQNYENGMQLERFAVCCGGKVVVRASGPVDFIATDFNPL